MTKQKTVRTALLVLVGIFCCGVIHQCAVSQISFDFVPIDPAPVELSEKLSLKEPLAVGLNETKIPGPVELSPNAHYKFGVDYFFKERRERRFPVIGLDSEPFEFDASLLVDGDQEQWRRFSFYFRAPPGKRASDIVFSGLRPHRCG